MTETEFVGSFSPHLDVSWGSCALDLPPVKESADVFILSQAAHICRTPDYDKSCKLFGLDQKAPSWAFFNPPAEMALSSQRCFRNGQILHLDDFTLQKSLEDLGALSAFSDKEIIVKCLIQIEELNKISKELYKNIFKFQKS